MKLLVWFLRLANTPTPPEIDPAGLIDEEAQFEALSGINWKSSTFEVLGSAGAEDGNEPGTSTQQAP